MIPGTLRRRGSITSSLGRHRALREDERIAGDPDLDGLPAGCSESRAHAIAAERVTGRVVR
jgi:hypothetical protein